MTTDAKGLRNEVVEAMAQALYALARDWEEMPWDEAPANVKAHYLEAAGAALDAALDILGTLDQQEKFSTPAVRLLLQRLRDSGKETSDG